MKRGQHLCGIIILLVLSVLLSGCATPRTFKTYGFKEKFPATQKKSIEIIERGEIVKRNYQIIGNVTIEGKTGVAKGTALRIMQQVAAEMGANGIIDVHLGPGCEWRFDGGMHYTGLAVKWIAFDEKPKPLDTPFVIYRLPIQDPKNPGKYLFTKNASWLDTPSYVNYPLADVMWVNRAIFKGYHVLPIDSSSFIKTTEELEEISEEHLNQIGGIDAQLLLNLNLVDYDRNNLGVNPVMLGLINSSEASIKATIYDKQSSSVILSKKTTGSKAEFGLLEMMILDDLSSAFGKAALKAVEDLPSISVQ